MVPRMFDFIPDLASDFFRHDPFRSLGLMGIACLAISMTTDFDLLAALGLVNVEQKKQEGTAPVA